MFAYLVSVLGAVCAAIAGAVIHAEAAGRVRLACGGTSGRAAGAWRCCRSR